MKNNISNKDIPSFLFNEGKEPSLNSLINLNLILNGLEFDKKPYQIDYQVLLMSYSSWKGNNLDEFCHKQTLSYFLFNPQNDSAVAREALFIEIREFLAGY